MKTKLLCLLLFAIALGAQNPPVNATQLRGRNISTTAPTNGQVYEWDTATFTWKPATVSGGASPAGSLGACQTYATSSTFGGDVNGCDLVFVAVATPSAPTLTVTCTAAGMETCSTAYRFAVVGHNLVGRTEAGLYAATAVGPDIPNSTNHILVTTAALADSTSCDVIETLNVGYLSSPACGASFNYTGQAGSARDEYFIPGNYTQGVAFGNYGFSLPLPADGIDAIHIGTPLTQFSTYTQQNAWYIAPMVIAYKGDFINGHSPLYVLSEDNGGGNFVNGALSTESVTLGTNSVQGQVSIAENFGSSLAPYLEGFSGQANLKPGATATTGRTFRARNGNFDNSTDGFTNYYGLECDDFSGTATKMACINGNTSAGSGKWFIYGAGTAASKLGGTIQTEGYISSDGTAGATVTTCTGFKNGLCISGT